jgi:hypothetical protein
VTKQFPANEVDKKADIHYSYPTQRYHRHHNVAMIEQYLTLGTLLKSPVQVRGPHPLLPPEWQEEEAGRIDSRLMMTEMGQMAAASRVET